MNAGDITAVIHVTTDGKTANTVTVNLPKTTQEQVIGNKIASVQLVIDRPDLTLGINLAAVTEINRQAKADVQLSATRMDNAKLSSDAKAAIGNRPTFDFKATYDNGKSVTDFGKGSISITIPYILGANEKAENVRAVYVDDKGDVHWLTGSVYDSVNQVLRFDTNHFFVYGVAYMNASSSTKPAASSNAENNPKTSSERSPISKGLACLALSCFGVSILAAPAIHRGRKACKTQRCL